MRARAIVIGASILALSAGSALSSAFASSRGSVLCRPGRSKLVAADTQSVVYLARVTSRPRDTSFTAYVGCIRGHRQAYVLGGTPVGSSSGAAGSRLYTVAGSIVAWEHSESTTGESGHAEWVLIVEDLRSGRVLRRVPTGIANPPVRGLVGSGPATQIVVDAQGALAWIVETASPAGGRPAQFEVHAADQGGTRTLASGADISPRSLALVGDTLYWTQDGKASSVTLQ
jgi:hypothetical protein